MQSTNLSLWCTLTITPDRRVASMTADQLANLSRLDDVEEMADDLAHQFGVTSDYDHRKYNEHDIIQGLKEVGDDNALR